MRDWLVGIGQIKLVILISLFSILAAVLLYLPLGYLIQGEVYKAGVIPEIYVGGIIIVIIISGIITPVISWYFVGLLIHVHELEVEMRELATYDYLTKVMTRKAFLTNSELLLNLSKRNQFSLSMLYIDLDNFKKINDIYGHSAGDKVLKSFGNIARSNTRTSDIVGRMGGEEFIFVLPNTDIKGAIEFADNFRNIIKNECITYNNNNIKYTISIGVSVYNTNNEVSIDELVRQSDNALYKAKNSGKDITILYED